MAVSVVHGYYRCTDVFFEWPKAQPNPDDVGPLRALLSYPALVNPAHPLHKQGVDGIELYITHFSNGQTRPVWSSAQLEFLQQWLFAMGLTRKPIPLPSSEFLIQSSDMTNCTPQVFSTAAELKKMIRNPEKYYKRLQSSRDSLLAARRHSFERVRTLWAENVGTWIAIDTEGWEHDQSGTIITELGWSRVRWQDGVAIEDMAHWIVEENKHHRNGTYVADRRDHYDYGKSELLKKDVLMQRVRELIGVEARQAGPLFLVFHDAAGDIRALRSPTVQAPIDNLSFVIPDSIPSEGIYAVDTSELFSALEGTSSADKRSLKFLLIALELHHDFKLLHLHNAGNDAHATMLCLKSMVMGESIDAQRSARWPEQMPSTEAKAIWNPYQEEELHQNTEAMLDEVMGVGDDGE